MDSSERLRRTAASVAALIAWFVALTLLIYFTDPGRALNRAANVWVAGTNVWLLGLIGVDSTLDGTYIHTSTFSVLIVDACNGLRAWVLFVPTCMTLRAPWKARSLAVLAGTAALGVFNQLRLVVEMLVGTLYPAYFDLVEEVLMRIVFVLLLLAVLTAWSRWNRRAPRPTT